MLVRKKTTGLRLKAIRMFDRTKKEPRDLPLSAFRWLVQAAGADCPEIHTMQQDGTGWVCLQVKQHEAPGILATAMKSTHLRESGWSCLTKSELEKQVGGCRAVRFLKRLPARVHHQRTDLGGQLLPEDWFAVGFALQGQFIKMVASGNAYRPVLLFLTLFGLSAPSH